MVKRVWEYALVWTQNLYYITVVNKGIAWNSGSNHSSRIKKLVKWPNKTDDGVNINIWSTVVYANSSV